MLPAQQAPWVVGCPLHGWLHLPPLPSFGRRCQCIVVHTMCACCATRPQLVTGTADGCHALTCAGVWRKGGCGGMQNGTRPFSCQEVSTGDFASPHNPWSTRGAIANRIIEIQGHSRDLLRQPSRHPVWLTLCGWVPAARLAPPATLAVIPATVSMHCAAHHVCVL